MPNAWSADLDYLLGDVVTHGGHVYEWSSADPDVDVEPPGGSWVQVDAAPSGASVDWADVSADSISLTATGENGFGLGVEAADAAAVISATGENGAVSISASGTGGSVNVSAAATANLLAGENGLTMEAGVGTTLGSEADLLLVGGGGTHVLTLGTKPAIPATPTAQDIADVLVGLGLASQAP